jgi:hypothetical protein
LTDDEAGSLYAALCESQTDGVIGHSGVGAFYAELTARYPEIDRVPNDRIDDHDFCPWSCALDRSRGHILMACVWSQAENVERFVRGVAARYGLAVYDPQQERVSYPGGEFAPGMNLDLESGWTIRGVSANDVRSCVEAESFAILSTDPNTYIQCAEQNEPPYGYDLEYQDGSLEQHYRARNEPITLERVLSAFLKYLRGDASWQPDFRWERMQL